KLGKRPPESVHVVAPRSCFRLLGVEQAAKPDAEPAALSIGTHALGGTTVSPEAVAEGSAGEWVSDAFGLGPALIGVAGGVRGDPRSLLDDAHVLDEAGERVHRGAVRGRRPTHGVGYSEADPAPREQAPAGPREDRRPCLGWIAQRGLDLGVALGFWKALRE